MTKFCFGECGYTLYSEIHLNYFNQLIHGLFMPFVVYGAFLGLPALLNQTGRNAKVVQNYLFLMYVIYYGLFDTFGTVLCVLLYGPCLHYANNHVYYPEKRWETFRLGLAWVLLAVGIQELIGHTLFEQVNSDLLQLPNSILIAPLFGARCLFHVHN